MADVINLRRERFLLDLKPTRKLQMFHLNKERQIIERWTKQEYVIRRMDSGYESYKRAIADETKADLEYQERLERRKIPQTNTKVRNIFKNRIVKLYNRLCHRFPNKIEYWNEFAAYAKSIFYFGVVNKIYSEALRFHSRNPRVWLDYATFFVEHQSNINQARHIMSLAIEANPLNEEMWLAYFSFERDYIHKLRQRVDITLEDDAPTLETLASVTQILWIVLDHAKQQIPALAFLVKFAFVLEGDEWAAEQQELLGRLVDEFGAEDVLSAITTLLCDNVEKAEMYHTLPAFATVSGETKTRLLDEIRQRAVHVPDEVELAQARIAESHSCAELREAILQGSWRVANGLKEYAAENIDAFGESATERTALLLWMIKTPCTEAFYTKAARWLLTQNDWESAKEVFEAALKVKEIARTSNTVWVEYLLACRKYDMMHGPQLMRRMQAECRCVSQVRAEYEERVMGH